MLKIRTLASRCRPAMSLAVVSHRQKHSLPDLPYDYNALEPVISAEIMQVHHSKHHATYVNNLNVLEDKLSEAKQKGNVSEIIALGPGLRFNGGGHINHSIFWQNLSPKGGGEPSGKLAAAYLRRDVKGFYVILSGPLLEAINKDFGSFANFKQRLTDASVAVQGSGWGWLGYEKKAGRLQVVACPNQDPLEATTGLVPLFGIDVWEHAYYLQYKNVRADYVKNIFNIANWKDVADRFAKAK